ncbi:hypothetical protein C0Q70_01367 [Pomacea canaliculata]|uniref:Uncharacterized protein n=1 Tax=Pomacea canaliculata TaxID=400727 RepID=A0A2T7PZ97_POMCA|nr:hypothetical protein C0Q70_01367 [Pomacea canaliculata]
MRSPCWLVSCFDGKVPPLRYNSLWKDTLRDRANRPTGGLGHRPAWRQGRFDHANHGQGVCARSAAPCLIPDSEIETTQASRHQRKS